MTPARSRTVTWEDPRALAEAVVAMGGHQFLEAMARGDLPKPPIAETLDFTAVEFGDGTAVFEFSPAEFHENPLGTVHGGVLATLLDSALGCAVQTKLSGGASYTTIELKVNYIRPLLAGAGPVRCAAQVVHVGGRIATAEGRALGADGRLYAHATTTCMVLRPEGS